MPSPLPLPPSATSGPLPLGSTEPRLWTRPLRPLTPATSYGFAVAEFARDVLCEPLDPWQEWLVIHAGELLADGRPRFRRVLVLVARQAGKTHALKVLSLFWQFVERWPLIVGMSTNLDYAREAWDKAVEAAESVEALSALLPIHGVRRANGEQCMTTSDRSRYKIAASNRKGGRSLSIDRLVIDELREHHDWSAWAAAYPAMNARPYGQAFALSNQGDDRSVVLDALREAALRFIETGLGDERLGLFEWSAADGSDLEDVEALAQANPNVGRRTDWDTLLGPARQAKDAGGEEEATYRTEVMCQRVRNLDAAVDPAAWLRCHQPDTLDAARGRVALCLDLSPDGLHATLAAAAVLPDDRVRVEVVAAWSGIGAGDALCADLPGWIDRVRPQTLGWFPQGPGAALAASLKDRRRPGWPPNGVTIAEIGAEDAAVCMGFATSVLGERIRHSADPLLDAHVAAAEKLRKPGERWVFSRRGGGHVDALYSAAGAVHLARTLPPAVGRQRIIRARTRGAAA
jgi:hypothetical protein